MNRTRQDDLPGGYGGSHAQVPCVVNGDTPSNLTSDLELFRS